MNRNAFRDFLRRRRVARHFAKNGGVFDFHGVTVRLPEGVDVAAANALIRGKYEHEEATLITRHLPDHLPIIELGGSLGVVSALVRSKLKPDTRHLIVEANPRLIEICEANAAAGRAGTEIIHGAVYYDGPVARFGIANEVHASAIGQSGSAEMIEVPAVTLSQLFQRLGSPPRFVLVSDVEGAEYDLFAQEAETLRHVELAIVELHPRNYAALGWNEAELIRNAASVGLQVAERLSDVVLLRRDWSIGQ
ncbi:MAG: FkbM family methyltransferase [Rhizobiaceae bacterium]